MRCQRCGGSTWCEVSEAYVMRRAPDRDDETAEQTEAKRAAVRGTVYPCPECRRPAFLFWRDGHQDPDHDRDNCQTCRDRGATAPKGL